MIFSVDCGSTPLQGKNLLRMLDAMPSDEASVLQTYKEISLTYPDRETIYYAGLKPSIVLISQIVEKICVPNGITLTNLDHENEILLDAASGFCLTKTPRKRAEASNARIRYVVPKGAIKLTDRASQMLLDLKNHFEEEAPGEDLVAELSWGQKAVKQNGRWLDLGEGLTLRFRARNPVPSEFYECYGDVEVLYSLSLNEIIKEKIDFVKEKGGFIFID